MRALINLNYLLAVCLLLAAPHTSAQPYAASHFTLTGHIDPETNVNQYGDKYSGCWGWYQAAKNKEYAIACSSGGTYWVDISVPSTPTVSCFRGGKQGCVWREVKTYQNYCYVISDDQGTNSFQIFDMQYLPDSVHKVYDSQALFNRGHTLWVDGNKLYIASVTLGNTNYSSMNVYSLANPASPALIRRLDQDYPLVTTVHDMFVRNDTVYASCAYQGLNVYKFTAANTFSLLGSLSNYPYSGYNHSSALTPDGRTLVFTDEIPVAMPVKVADVTNLSNIQVLATTNQFPQTTPHNPFIVSNQYCFMSSYQDGLQLYDISNPSSPALAGYFDTYPLSGGNNNTWPSGSDYEGQWGAYPYFPSKCIFALDESNGIFILNTDLYKNEPVTAGFSMPTATACAGSTFNFASTGTNATSYTWSASGGTPAGANDATFAVFFASPGVYTVTLLAANPSYSAAATQTLMIVPGNLSSAVSTTNASCNSCSTGIALASANGGTAPFSYTWQPQGGNTALASGLAPGCYTVSIKDANGCVSATAACLSFFTGLAASELDAGAICVYPNPAQDNFSIVCPGQTFSYALYNSAGQLMLSNKKISQKIKIGLGTFPKGIYSIEIETETSKTNQKIVIE